jgi:pimeloyl-ACP methyl ester carboxylesterase
MIRKISYIILLQVSFLLSARAQQFITFQSSDNVTISSDFYETEAVSKKWMIMCHQEEYSRGEFKEIAQRMIKLNFNCLAIDMRSGGEVNYVQNETALEAKNLGKSQTLLACEIDILSAIEYVKSREKDAEIVLFGSSFSASLCLKIAKERPDIKAVIAFSPGEFFTPQISMKKTLAGISIPIYVGSTKSEYSYVKEMFENVKPQKLVLFRPEKADGMHGAKTLWWESTTRNEYWLSLLFFLNSLQ